MEVVRTRRGGRRAGMDTTVLTDSVEQWCWSLSTKAAVVALYVAQHDGIASCTEVRQHLGNLFHDGRPVSPAALGGVMACGGRALRVDRDGEPGGP